MSGLRDRVKAATAAGGEQGVPEPGENVEALPAGAEEDSSGQDGPGTDVASRDAQLSWLRQYGGYFEDALPRHVDRAHFIAAARAVLPDLAQCSNASILQSLLACARFGLTPDGRHAAIVPFGKIATFVAMYEGYIDLMYRSGRVDSVHFNWVHAADQWDYTPTAPAPYDFVHKPQLLLRQEERGPVVLAYAFAWIKGGGRSQVVILTRWDAEAIRDEFSRSYRKAERKETYDSPWHTAFDAMWAKSCVRRLTKVVPTSPELVHLLNADDAADGGRPAVIHTVVSEMSDRVQDQADVASEGDA